MTYYQVNKWGRAKKQEYDGKHYDSKFEAAYAKDLTMQLRAGLIKGFDTHVRIPLVVNGFHICDYYIDFLVEHLDGIKEYAETKGLKTPVWVIKWKILEAMTYGDPLVKLTLVQQKKFKLRRIRRI